MIGRRILVIGPTGSGKTTLARQLSELLDLPHIELDAIHWGADWALPTVREFRRRVADVAAGDEWVMDGNYSKVRDITWGRAEVVVWLDYGLLLTLWRLLLRTTGRLVRRELLWHGNRESVRGQFFSRESLFVWAVKSHGRRRREYHDAFGAAEHNQLERIRFVTPGESETWLRRLAKGVGG